MLTFLLGSAGGSGEGGAMEAPWQKSTETFSKTPMIDPFPSKLDCKKGRARRSQEEPRRPGVVGSYFICWDPWRSVGICGDLWGSVGISRDLCGSVVICRDLWGSVRI